MGALKGVQKGPKRLKRGPKWGFGALNEGIRRGPGVYFKGIRAGESPEKRQIERNGGFGVILGVLFGCLPYIR